MKAGKLPSDSTAVNHKLCPEHLLGSRLFCMLLMGPIPASQGLYLWAVHNVISAIIVEVSGAKELLASQG